MPIPPRHSTGLAFALFVVAGAGSLASTPLPARDVFSLFDGYHRHRRPAPVVARPPAPVPLPPPRPHLDVEVPAPKPEPARRDSVAGQPVPAPAPAEAQHPAAPAIAVAPSGARLDDAPRQPADDATCPGRLKTIGVEAEPAVLGPQPDPRCTVVGAVRLRAITLRDGTTVATPDNPTIACTTAETFGRFVRDLVAPLVKGTYDTTMTTIWTGPGLECRSRDHVQGAKLSAHGQGLAVDIAQVRFASGRTIAVGDPQTEIDTGFEAATRAGACGYFHTVLGPGSDSYHRNHWHFDLIVRGAKGDSKFCQ